MLKNQLAILLDPDKPRTFIPRGADLILVGGSTLPTDFDLDAYIRSLRSDLADDTPIWLFPGDCSQLSSQADGLLYLSLLSGRNPDYLVGQHVRSARAVRASGVAVYPTGYILIDGGTDTSTMRVTGTRPLAADDVDTVVSTAIAAELLGMRYVYLEAGSGALHPVPESLIRAVRAAISLPIIVGGGLRSRADLDCAYAAGADICVVGNYLENHPDELYSLL